MAEKTAETATTLPALLESENVKARFVEILESVAGASSFIQGLLQVYNSNPQLKKCKPRSILAAAGVAATLKLSLSPALGQAYVVPYNDEAQFQIGVRGLVQLAHRTGKYVRLNADVVYEGEITGRDCITGDLLRGEKISDKVVGYVAYMKLNNGFEQWIYMTKEQMEEHAQEFSRTYAYDKRQGKRSSTWSKRFDSMAKKTVLKLLLNHWGAISPDLALALQGDQATASKTTFTYVDNGGNTVPREDFSEIEQVEQETTFERVDAETGEILDFDAAIGGEAK